LYIGILPSFNQPLKKVAVIIAFHKQQARFFYTYSA